MKNETPKGRLSPNQMAGAESAAANSSTSQSAMASANVDLIGPASAMTPVSLFEAGFGPNMVSCTIPGASLAPTSKIRADDLGKVPGKLTPSGWTGQNWMKDHCPDRKTAELWEGWKANVGIRAGGDLAFVWLDNDFGVALSRIIRAVFEANGVDAPRRFVCSPTHERDAFLIRVHDFVSQPTTLPTRRFGFSQGNTTGKLEVFTERKQMLASGDHPCGHRYVWDRKLLSVESDVPIVDEDTFNAILDGITTRAQTEGINLTAATTGGGPVRGSANGEGVGMRLALDELREALTLIPNRDVPLGESPAKSDEWLDDYDNWTSTAYMALAACGNTAETRALWLGWANGRAQPDQSAESVYDSAALSADCVRFDGRHLLWLVRDLIGNPSALAPKFPDLTEVELAAAVEAEKWAAETARKVAGSPSTAREAFDLLRSELRWRGSSFS
jgi:hypothetical protein